MNSSTDKTHQQLLNELADLRKKAVEMEDLQNRLRSAEKALSELTQRFEVQGKEFAREREERNHAEKALRLSQLIVHQSPVILFRRLAGEQPVLEYVSENINRFGYSAEEFLSGAITYRQIVHPDDDKRVSDEIQQYTDEDLEEYSQLYRCVTKSGDVRWVEDKTSVVRDSAGNKTHNQGILIDVTERKLAQQALSKSEEKYRRIVETATEGFVLLSEDLVITDVNDAYCRMMGYSREELIGTRTIDIATPDFRQYLLAHLDDLLAKDHREFEGKVVTKDGREVPVLIHGSTLRDDRGKVIGNMAFVTDMTEHKKALVLAGEVQKSLLPEGKPQVAGLDVAGRNVSCDEIGGDYFDFLWRRGSGKGPLSVVVGDISGHGVDSALLMTTARAFLRMRASQPGTIAEIITAMNHHLANDVLESGRFMTLFYLSIDPDQKKVKWVRAGHDPALIYDPQEDDFEELRGEGIALGVMNEFSYEEQNKDGLKEGQILAIGTDGIWESFNSAGEMFGKERFRNIIRIMANESASDIVSAVYDELGEFTLGQKSEDDMTLVVIKVGAV